MLGRFKLDRRWGRRLLVGATWAGVAAGAYFWGRSASLPEATATPAPAANVEDASPVPSGRVVAYIHNNVPISREELGEYLIARYGKDKLEHLINKKIIDHAAKAKGIEITAAEISASLNADRMAAGAKSVKEFTDAILKRYGKTEYEWREDVIKPRLVLEKMCRARVSVTREDLAKAYEAHHGAKVDCKMILFPKEEKNYVLNKVWPAVRNSDEQFDHYARMQSSPSLAAVGGHIKPIGKHTTGSEKLEKVLFSLRPGMVSEVLDEPEGLVILKCIKHLDPEPVPFDSVKDKLEKEVFDKKVALEIGKLFRELSVQANPVNLLKPTNPIRDVEKELQLQPKATPAPVAVPAGETVPPPSPVPSK